MFDFYQKRKLRTIVNSPYTQGFILLIALWVGVSAYVRYDIAMEMFDRRVLSEQQTNVLESRKEALQEHVQYLTNERGIEAEMRRQFDVALKGEQVVVIVEDELEESEVKPLSNNEQKKVSKKWYQFWK